MVVYRLSPKRRQVKAEEGQSWLLSLAHSLTPRAARFPDYASHNLSASPPGLQNHNGSSTYEVSNFSWITLKEISWSNSAWELFKKYSAHVVLANPRCQGDTSTKLLIISTTAVCFLSQQYSFVQNGSKIAESSLALPSSQAQVQLEQLYLNRSTVCCPLDLSVKHPIHCCLSCMRLFM